MVPRPSPLTEVPKFAARIVLKKTGANSFRIHFDLAAEVVQSCVVTLEPLTNTVEEKVNLVFLPQAVSERQFDDEAAVEPQDVKWDDPEPLIGGVVDLGAVAIEFLILGLDPYPRKADAVFEPPAQDDGGEGPFSALAKLKS